jgi:superfamily II DNA or RNA helicase
MSIPIGRTDLIPAHYQIDDRRYTVPVEFPTFQGNLRPSQQEVYDEVSGNCIINAKPSWGKTFAGLAIAGKLRQKTLVVVHTVPLRNQWAREVQKVYGIQPGIIGSSKYNISGPIVIGNVQSLYNCIDRIYKDFGTIILDEMHHVSSPTFSRVMDKCYARYKIGLSGTIKRKDGKDVVFKDYFGSHIIQPAPENSMKPTVHVIDSGLVIPEMPGQASWALRVNALLESPAYRMLIHKVVDFYTNLGHKTLIVADRVEFLTTMAESRPRAVVVTGQVQDGREELIASIGPINNELWGGISIFKEGISQDILSCLVLATPVNNEPMLEQLIGRIQRIVDGKKNPIVVDIKMSGWTGHKQFQARLGHYMRMGYEVKYL